MICNVRTASPSLAGGGKLAATVTKDDIPRAGQAVDMFLCVGVDEHRAVAADPHPTGPLNHRDRAADE